MSLVVSAPGASSATTSFTSAGAKVVAPPTLDGNVTRFSDTKFANLFLALAVGAVVLLGALLLFRPSSNQRLQKRIEGYAQISEKRPSERAEGESRSPLFQRLLVATEGLLGRLKYWQHAGFLLQQADMPLRAAELFYIQLGAGAVLGIVSVLFGAPIILSLILFAVGVVLPYLYVKRKAGKRTKKFEAQLPDTLVAVAASLRAGHSFAQAMSTIVKDGGEPAAKEFGRVEAETSLGRSTDDALQAMAERLASRNFEFVVLAVNIQRQVGGSLAEILDMVADTVREREQFSRKVKALTAMGRASAYVLVGDAVLDRPGPRRDQLDLHLAALHDGPRSHHAARRLHADRHRDVDPPQNGQLPLLEELGCTFFSSPSPHSASRRTSCSTP